MKRLEFGESSKLADVLNAVSGEADKEIEIFVFPGSEVLKTRANKDVIYLFAASLGKSIIFKGGEAAEVAKEAVGEKENLGFIEGKDVAEEPVIATPRPAAEKKKWFSLPKIGFLKGPKWVYALAGLVVLVVVGSFALFWLVPGAMVTLFTDPQLKDSELTLVASASVTSPDADKGVIPLKTYEVNEEDSLEAKATGEKTVGTPAKGKVAVINRTTEEKTFFAGTTLMPISGPQIQFALDQTATVSASPPLCTDTCAQVSADVTAKTIGEEGNLPANTVFKIGTADLNLVGAKSLTNFTGGTKKKITVVSADDQKKAKDDLLKKLESKAKEDLKKDHSDIVIPEGGLESTIVDEVYDKKVDEEADSFKLSLQVKFTAKIFSEKDLKDLLIKSIEGSLPFGYQVDREKSQVSSEILEKTGEDLKVLGKIKANLVPVVNTEEVRRNITGKNFTTTENYLKSLGGVSSFEVKMNPSFFQIFKTMPHLGSRIKIEVKQKE